MIEYFKSMLDITRSIAGEELLKCNYPWEILDNLGELIIKLGKESGYSEIMPNVWVGNDVKISNTAEINGPCIIGDGSEIRHCAFIRGNALIGKNCVVGNSTELKNCILFDKTQVPHYNYVGDSILGCGSHLGAGSVISNLKNDGKSVSATVNHERMDTGRRKFGAILCDGVNAGCGCVINPGSVVGKSSQIYPHSTVRGEIPAGHIYKNKDEIVPIV